MDKNKAKMLGEEVQAAITLIAAKHNMKPVYKGSTYDPAAGTWRPKIEFFEKEIDGKPREQAEFEKYCHLFGMTAEHYGKTFVSGRGTFKVVGLSLNRRKFPIIAEPIEGGKRLLFTEEAVARIIGRAVPS